MSFSANFMDKHLSSYKKNSSKFFIWGLILMALGLFAVTATTFTTLVTVIVLGFLLLFSGLVILLDTFTFWRDKGHGFSLSLLASVLYIAAGILLISNPVESSISLTFLLGVIYTFLGLARIFFYSMVQLPQWGWSFANGIITFLIGILILMSWPASSLFIIGLFVGIDLFFCGLAYTMVSVAARGKSRR
ncbi:MAG TPA: DUF308 domain-containing protein [Gammaproteobacteria bacterium]|jgi:uncharacterized membrane protein HdeD (DUF308 family)|nr:DUF308 domain-containing protein [Gammaproteobacteria bacterium]